MTPERDPWPSVEEHPAEIAFDEAQSAGRCALLAYSLYRLYGCDEDYRAIGEYAREAASLFHWGECLSGRHRNGG